MNSKFILTTDLKVSQVQSHISVVKQSKTIYFILHNDQYIRSSHRIFIYESIKYYVTIYIYYMSECLQVA